MLKCGVNTAVSAARLKDSGVEQAGEKESLLKM